MPDHHGSARRRPARMVLWTALVAACLLAASAHADPREVVLQGELGTAGGARPASLHVRCEPAANGVLSFELWVPHASTTNDFDYDDFEGPDAAARDRALSHLTLKGGGDPEETRHAAAGWYAGEEPETFVFGVSDRSHTPGKLTTLARALRPDHTQLTWVQQRLDDASRALEATFALDASTVARLRTTIDPCLTPPAKTPAKKQP